MEIKKLFQKRFVSIILTGVFLVVSISGVLMFFMVESFSMNQVHAWVGMGFVVIGIYHLIKNFSPFKNYMKYTSSSILLLLILGGSLFYIKPLDDNLVSPKKEMMKAIFTQPISTVCTFFNKDVDQAIKHLKQKGVIVKDEKQTLMQIAKENNEEIKKLFFMFFEK